MISKGRQTGPPEGTGRYAKFELIACVINFLQRDRDNVGKRLQYVLQKGKTCQENGLGARRDHAEKGSQLRGWDRSDS